MKLVLALSAATFMLAPGIVLAQRAPLTDKEAPAPAAVTPSAQGRSTAEPNPDTRTASGRPSDSTGTQSMAPSSGNNPSGEPDSGMGRGDK